jgi:AbrB family looped-hinge helix DNA binding protein
MPVVTVKNKYQVVIPAKVREQVGIHVGDLLEAKAQNGKVILTPKSLVDREIAEGLEDLRKGKTYGPFNSAEDMIRALHRTTRKARKNTRGG